MRNHVVYRNSVSSSKDKNTDPVSGSLFWSLSGANVQFTWFDVPANTNFPAHKHNSEQITYVLEGDLFFKTQTHVYKLSAGDCILIPAGIDHEAWTENIGAKAVDAWSPVNEVYSSELIHK